MNKVYIVEGQTLSVDDTTSTIAGVHTTEEGARKRMREEIDSLCADIKEDLEEQFEDNAEDFEDYKSFKEYWNDWVAEHFVTKNFWRYSDETDFAYIVSIIEKNVED